MLYRKGPSMEAKLCFIGHSPDGEPPRHLELCAQFGESPANLPATASVSQPPEGAVQGGNCHIGMLAAEDDRRAQFQDIAVDAFPADEDALAAHQVE